MDSDPVSFDDLSSGLDSEAREALQDKYHSPAILGIHRPSWCQIIRLLCPYVTGSCFGAIPEGRLATSVPSLEVLKELKSVNSSSNAVTWSLRQSENYLTLFSFNRASFRTCPLRKVPH